MEGERWGVTHSTFNKSWHSLNISIQEDKNVSQTSETLKLERTLEHLVNRCQVQSCRHILCVLNLIEDMAFSLRSFWRTPLGQELGCSLTAGHRSNRITRVISEQTRIKDSPWGPAGRLWGKLCSLLVRKGLSKYQFYQTGVSQMLPDGSDALSVWIQINLKMLFTCQTGFYPLEASESNFYFTLNNRKVVCCLQFSLLAGGKHQNVQHPFLWDLWLNGWTVLKNKSK